MIEKINMKIRKTDSMYLFHDAKEDINTLTKICNKLIDKVNELIDEINMLKK